MHIVIYGVGAIGGFFGSLLADHINSPENTKHKNQISFIARGHNLEAIQEEGLTLIRNKGTDNEEIINQEVDIYEDFKDLNDVDAVLLCVKCKDTLNAAEDISQNLKDDAYVVSIQNGIDNEAKLSTILGQKRVMGCLTNITAQNEEPGVYSQAGNYSIIFGELDNSESPRLKQLYNLFKESNINALTSKEIQKDLWTKLVWNAAFNPITALHKLNIGELYNNEEHMKTVKGIMLETIQVAQAEGIDLEPSIADKHIQRTAAAEWKNFKTSMLQDTLAGKEIELDELLGVVIRRAQKHKINTPNALLIYNSLKE